MNTFTLILTVCAATLAASAAHSALAADRIIVSQRYDAQNGLPSERNVVPAGEALTADDFHLSSDATLSELSATFIIDDRVEPITWEVSIHENRRGEPGLLRGFFTGGEMRDTGQDFDPRHHPQWAVVEVTWNLENLRLERGLYWVIARGVGEERLFQRAWWATANTNRPDGREAMFLSDFFFAFDWTDWSDMDTDAMLDRDIDFEDVPFDTAFTLRGEMRGDAASVRRLRATRGIIIGGGSEEIELADDIEMLGFSETTADGEANFALHGLARVRGRSRDAQAIDVSIEAHLSQRAGVGELFFREAGGGRWQRIAAFPLGIEPGAVVITGVDAPAFMNEDGSIRFMLRLSNPGAGGLPFFAWIDLLSIETR